MALATLADLRAVVLDLRTDLAAKFLSEILPLAEQRIYYGDGPVPPLRVLPMETSGDLTFTAGAATLPPAFLDKRALYWVGSGGQTVSLSYEPPSVFYPASYGRLGGSWPSAYTIEGTTVKISPSLSGTAKMIYYARPAVMAADGDTNVVLASWPGVYLFGCQIERFRLERNDAEMAKARQMYADAITAANKQALVARSLGGPLRKRVGFGI